MRRRIAHGGRGAVAGGNAADAASERPITAGGSGWAVAVAQAREAATGHALAEGLVQRAIVAVSTADADFADFIAGGGLKRAGVFFRAREETRAGGRFADLPLRTLRVDPATGARVRRRVAAGQTCGAALRVADALDADPGDRVAMERCHPTVRVDGAGRRGRVCFLRRGVEAEIVVARGGGDDDERREPDEREDSIELHGASERIVRASARARPFG